MKSKSHCCYRSIKEAGRLSPFLFTHPFNLMNPFCLMKIQMNTCLTIITFCVFTLLKVFNSHVQVIYTLSISLHCHTCSILYLKNNDSTILCSDTHPGLVKTVGVPMVLNVLLLLSLLKLVSQSLYPVVVTWSNQTAGRDDRGR